MIRPTRTRRVSPSSGRRLRESTGREQRPAAHCPFRSNTSANQRRAERGLYVSDRQALEYDFAQLQSGGFTAQLVRLANANSYSPAVRSFMLGNLGTVRQGIAESVDAYLHGEPVSTADINAKMLAFSTALKAVLTALEEINVLVDANPGTLKTIASEGMTHGRLKRIFP